MAINKSIIINTFMAIKFKQGINLVAIHIQSKDYIIINFILNLLIIITFVVNIEFNQSSLSLRLINLIIIAFIKGIEFIHFHY